MSEGGKRFSGRAVLVTGAASGIGLATARAFAAEGARLAVADVDAAGARRAAAALREAGAEALDLALDVADFDQCERAVAATVAAFGGLHVAFNNAGVPSRVTPRFEDLTLAEWDRVIAVNLTGVFHCLKAEAPAMRASGGGAIVNTASVASHVGGRGMGVYVASKHGVAGLTKCAALDLISDSIRVNAICPGMIRTPMVGPLLDDPALAARMTAQIPAGRAGEADEIARAVLFLASPEASYMVGALLLADGGVVLQ